MAEIDAIEAYKRENSIPITETDDMPVEGTLLLDKYKVTGRLEVASKEVSLYLCTYDYVLYVAKVYRRKLAVDRETLFALAKIDSPYVARLFAAGKYNDHPVEILPYYKNGTLQKRAYTESELIHYIIPGINEGLHALHQAGILHKDLKPANLVLNDDEHTVSIIDYGMDSAAKLQGMPEEMTTEYSAPETFRNEYYIGSDYYAMGITLFELASGYTPYANMNGDEIVRAARSGKMVFPAGMSNRLQNLITGLTYAEIANRDDPNSPDRRWTYEEVRKWLKGESLPVPGNVNISKPVQIRPFAFNGKEYTDIGALVAALAKNWEDGKKQLFRSELSTYFKLFNKDMAAKCLAAEEEAAHESGKDDIIFWRTLYRMDPQLKGIYWKGRVYESLPALGREILENVWNEDGGMYPYYDSVFADKLLSQYVLMTAPGNEKLTMIAKTIEDSYELEITEGSDMLKTYFRAGYTLSGQKIYRLNGEKFATIGEFAGYMKRLLDNSKKEFIELCHQLMTYQGTIKDVQLEVWLSCLGKDEELNDWRALMDS